MDKYSVKDFKDSDKKSEYISLLRKYNFHAILDFLLSNLPDLKPTQAEMTLNNLQINTYTKDQLNYYSLFNVFKDFIEYSQPDEGIEKIDENEAKKLCELRNSIEEDNEEYKAKISINEIIRMAKDQSFFTFNPEKNSYYRDYYIFTKIDSVLEKEGKLNISSKQKFYEYTGVDIFEAFVFIGVIYNSLNPGNDSINNVREIKEKILYFFGKYICFQYGVDKKFLPYHHCAVLFKDKYWIPFIS